jgi:ankyrin repeat protein
MDDDATPLFIACQNGHLEVVRELLARGANPRLVTNSGATAHSVATHKGHAAIVQLLTEQLLSLLTAALAAP